MSELDREQCPECRAWHGAHANGCAVLTAAISETFSRKHAVDAYARAKAAEAEQLRQERHHDIMARVIEKLAAGYDILDGDAERKLQIVEAARLIADAAYPPPKGSE